MPEIEFNLIEEKWVRVLMPDCSVQEVSLTEALLRAHEFRDLAGELPTQDAAVLRLLLAVLQAVFYRVDETGAPAALTNSREALQRWKQLWTLRRFPEAPIQKYLADWKERFWLFHHERPFYQVPEAEIGTKYGASKLNGEISQSNDKLRLFCSYSGYEKDTMSYTQAARWLIYINGFDDTSLKKKGKGLPSISTGWLGKLGLIFAQGNNLFETLMLNLTLLKDGAALWGAPMPCWELEQPRSAQRCEIAPPDNAAALLTLQSRRLLLKRENERVTGFTLLGGDFFQEENAFSDQMTLWKAASVKKNAPITYQPLHHDPAKQLWRQFPAIAADTEHSHSPGIVRWISTLQGRELLPRKRIVQFRIVSAEYGKSNSSITDTFQDSISFHALLLDELGVRWKKHIRDEIENCQKACSVLEKLAEELIIAAGYKDGTSKKVNNKSNNTGNKRTRRVKEHFYFQIDRPFRDWLYAIDPEWDEDEADRSLLAWREKARQTALVLGQQMVEQAGPIAFVGRTIKKEGTRKSAKAEQTYYCSAPKAHMWFQNEIRKIYPKGGEQ